MDKIFIYHNPRWGKSRESVKILENAGEEYEIINYIESPPSSEELQILADKMDIQAHEFIRKKESIFKELGLQAYIEDDKTLFQYMSSNPKLIERPIVVKGDRAVLGRPPEKIIEFLKTWFSVTICNNIEYRYIIICKLLLSFRRIKCLTV